MEFARVLEIRITELRHKLEDTPKNGKWRFFMEHTLKVNLRMLAKVHPRSTIFAETSYYTQ
jgi:hypothetical protein